MTLEQALDKHARSGSLERADTLTGAVYTATTQLGAHRGRAYSVTITVIAYFNGKYRTTTQVWSGDHRVTNPPLEANWPVVKALREIAAGDQGDEVVTRLLAAALRADSSSESLEG